MNEITRRRFLAFIGAGAGATVAAGLPGAREAIAAAPGAGLTPVRLPHPLPIYTQRPSYLATGIGTGTVLPPAAAPNLTEFTIIDDVVVPPEYERYVILRWGDRPFADGAQYVGYNHDYTGFVSRTGNPNDGYLWINHEYVSFPFSALSPGAPANLAALPSSFESVIGFPFPATKNREALGEMCYNTGGSIVRIQRPPRGGRFSVVAGDTNNRRIYGLSGLAINAERDDAYADVTSWGQRPHQIGDDHYLVGTGPAAADVFEDVNADGLGNRIIGTSFNCSGATTPWGTIMSAEENFQADTTFFIGVQEGVLPTGTQTGYVTGSSGAEFGQVGEKYGWMVEIDPRDPGTRARKHTALGRFRHENVALRCTAGQPLIVYLGDDRRGGHTWKFVSSGTVADPKSRQSSDLLESGTLHVARFNPDGSGTWVPLLLTSPTNPISPTDLSSVERAARSDGSAQQNGRIRLPRRNGVAGQAVDGGFFVVDLTNEAAALPAYQGKTLADFYPTQGALLCDAFLAGNLVGGTPGARPEDIEVHPDTNHVFVAFTDGAAGSDGYPDSRVFVVGKYTTTIDDTQPHGALYRIVEDSAEGTGTSFTWTRFVQGGEVGADDGVGFAAVDNLAFDGRSNLWGVTDMSTGNHNGFSEGAVSSLLAVSHTASAVPNTGSAANLVAVFGNNWVFFIPTKGPHAGQVIPFAYGPTRCEMTGPTFLKDTLILSVQHPSEDCPINDGTPASVLSRSLELLGLDGSLFNQTRVVLRGSNWPSNISGNPLGPPRPCTIGIRRLANGPFA